MAVWLHKTKGTFHLASRGMGVEFTMGPPRGIRVTYLGQPEEKERTGAYCSCKRQESLVLPPFIFTLYLTKRGLKPTRTRANYPPVFINRNMIHTGQPRRWNYNLLSAVRSSSAYKFSFYNTW